MCIIELYGFIGGEPAQNLDNDNVDVGYSDWCVDRSNNVAFFRFFHLPRGTMTIKPSAAFTERAMQTGQGKPVS